MGLTVLSVAYPMAPVSPDAVGGAEQVLAQLDAALTAAGHTSLVVANCKSAVTGMLIPLPDSAVPYEQFRPIAHACCKVAISEALACYSIDVIHFHGVDFAEYLPQTGPPALATLHLPPSWYPAEIFTQPKPNLFLNCVSESQHLACPPCPQLLPPISNGVPVQHFMPSERRGRFAFAMGRICQEKGFHLAIDACQSADVPLLLAGSVFPYASHVEYYERCIAPRESNQFRFLGPVGLRQKARLLAKARCVVVPSLAQETSSLTAMESLAAGTPVIAFNIGALPHLIEHGRTGFIASNVEEMAEMIGRTDEIDPAECRRDAISKYSLASMVEKYFAVYSSLADCPPRGDVATRAAERITSQ